MAKLNIEFSDEPARAIQELTGITGRSALEVVCDALKVYEWILQEQTLGRRIVSIDGRPGEESELDDFVVNKNAARAYFAARERT